MPSGVFSVRMDGGLYFSTTFLYLHTFVIARSCAVFILRISQYHNILIRGITEFKLLDTGVGWERH